MVASVGVFALAVCVVSALLVVAIGSLSWVSPWQRYKPYIDVFVHLAFISSVAAIVLLGYAFVSNDFSLIYVSSHSNTQLPIFFKIAAVWGGHEGSLLFWLVTLAGWTWAIARHKRSIPDDYRLVVLVIMALITAIFALFCLFVSNAFDTNAVLPLQGRDLNPMLQDIGLVLHPPLLYIGYVGFAATFAFAFAALLMPAIPNHWYQTCRNWNAVAWVFLTVGIVLGSWWAYKELGWGGWWFWDPVENSSLLPWLTATALMHSLTVSQHRRQLLGWSFGLAIITFCLSLLGTFVVRSGVLTSVHAFAVDPTKGLLLLAILAVLLLSALAALIWRSDKIVSEPITGLLSRAGIILMVCGVLAAATLVVWLGTFYPMIYQLLNLGNISVGAPYFNQMILPLSLFGLALMVVVRLKNIVSHLIKVLIVGVSLTLSVGFYLALSLDFDWLLFFTTSLAIIALVVHLMPSGGGSLAMRFAHIGAAMVVFAAVANAQLSYEQSEKMRLGSSMVFHGAEVTFVDRTLHIGPNYTSEQVHLELVKGDQALLLVPEKRHYQVRNMLMSEPAIKSSWSGDYYVTIGEKLDNQSFAVRIQYRAFIGWIWFGALLCSIAVVFIFLPSRESKALKQVEQHVKES